MRAILNTKSGRLYVATARGFLVGETKTWKQVRKFGKPGRKSGEFAFPTGIAVDDDETIYVADSMNYRIQAITKDGKVKWVLGKTPDPGKAILSKDRTFGLPSSLALGPDGYLYVLDAFNGEIVIVDSDKGDVVKTIGEWGNDDGQFYFPAGIKSLRSDLFVVADKYNDRVQVVRIASPAGVPFVALLPRFNPLWLILLLIPFALLPFLFARRKYVISGAFMEKILDKRLLSEFKEASGKVFMDSEDLERLSVIFEDLKAEIGNFVFSVDARGEILEELRSRLAEVDDSLRKAIAVAKSMRTSVLLCLDSEVDVVELEGVRFIPYSELIEESTQAGVPGTPAA